MEGEKKYSPPLGTTHSMGKLRNVLWSLGYAPTIQRGRKLGPLLS